MFCCKVQILSIVGKPQTPVVALELIAPFEAQNGEGEREDEGGRAAREPTVENPDRVTWKPFL